LLNPSVSAPKGRDDLLEDLMKRLALLLAAAVLGTGCIVNDDDTVTLPPNSGTLDLGWTFIRTKVLPVQESVVYTCAQAGVDNLLVQSTTGGSAQVPCDGSQAALVSLSPGPQTITVIGRRGAVQLFSTFFDVSIATGQTVVQDVDLFGIPDELDVFALFRDRFGGPGWSTCFDAGVASLSFSIVDGAGTEVATGTVSCTDPAGVSFTGAQALDRDDYAIRMLGFPAGSLLEDFDSATTAVAPVCNGQPFNHFGPSVGVMGGWTVLLYDVSSNSTFCP
jgi:hypothetical protein